MRVSHIAYLLLIAATNPSAAVAQEIRISHQWAEQDARDRTARVFTQEAEMRAQA